MEGPDALEVLDVCGRDLGEIRKALRALAAAIGVPLTLLGRIRGILEEGICVRLRELVRCRLLIEDRDENRKPGSEDPGANRAQLACTPSRRPVKHGSDQDGHDEEDEGAD